MYLIGPLTEATFPAVSTEGVGAFLAVAAGLSLLAWSSLRAWRADEGGAEADEDDPWRDWM